MTCQQLDNMGRPRRDWRSTSRETYKLYKAKTGSTISYQKFAKVLKTWNCKLMDYVIDTGELVKLPHGIGPITINKRKRDTFRLDKDGNKVYNYAIDFKKSKEAGKRIYHLNYHTEGYSFSWSWFPGLSYIKCSSIWSFKASRRYARKLAHILLDPASNKKDIYQTWWSKSVYNEQLL
jgi:hypothetical protein